MKFYQVKKDQTAVRLSVNTLEDFLNVSGFSVGNEEMELINSTVKNGGAYLLLIDKGFKDLVKIIITR